MSNYKYTVKANKVVAKLYNDNNAFVKSFIIPTERFPLQSNSFKVFTYENTKVLEDKDVIDIIDSCKWKVGHCYGCHDELYKRLKEKGIDASYYVGWVFRGKTPIHHAWVVVNQEYLIDLSDDEWLFVTNLNSDESNTRKQILEQFKKSDLSELTIDEWREVRLSFVLKTQKMKNSERCMPLGYICSEQILYVGCESTADLGRLEYNRLMQKFPNHESYTNVDKSTSTNKFNRMLDEAGYYD